MEFMRARLQIRRLFQFGEHVQRPAKALGLAVATGMLCSTGASASFAGPYGLSQFTLTNTPSCQGTIPDASAVSFDGGLTVLFTGSNSGSGCNVTSTLTIQAAATGTVSFDYSYALTDIPGFDFGSWLKGSTVTQIGAADGDSGTVSFLVTQGQLFGFQIDSDDQGGTGTLTISNFSAPLASTGVPEPSTLALAVGGLGLLAGWKARKARIAPGSASRQMLTGILALGVLAAAPAYSQVQNYAGSNATGIMTRTAVVNLTTLAGGGGFALRSGFSLTATSTSGPEFVSKTLRNADAVESRGLARQIQSFSLTTAVTGSTTTSLPVTTASGLVGFNGLTHKDQRESNGGNQFSIEPPNQSIAVSNGYILEGVNNAVRVFSITGTPLVPTVSSNQVFAVSPAINRTTGVYGVYGTDMRVFYDQTLDRWFILQRSQDNDANGNLLASSKIYIAVSQTNDPTQNYNVYTIDTTHHSGNDFNLACPCIADYPQIGADQYGFYIAANEYGAPSGITFVSATVLAISKASLAANAVTPTLVRFTMSNVTGYEFSLQPASTAPGSSSFLASGGLEYFTSTISVASGSNIGLWAMTNTSSLGTATPNLAMTRIIVPTLPYIIPNVSALQKNGPLTLGGDITQYNPPFTVARPIDGGDSRVQSVIYAGGKLYLSWATLVTDENLHNLSGGIYTVVTPTYRLGALAASVNKQGYLQVSNNNLLRPYWAVNSKGKGAIVFTLVGPDYFPSAAFITADSTSIGTSVQIAAAGIGPEDGFTGYDDGVARWGDYSTAVATADGSIWMVGQYIPNLPRTIFANWGTYVFRYVP